MSWYDWEGCSWKEKDVKCSHSNTQLTLFSFFAAFKKKHTLEGKKCGKMIAAAYLPWVKKRLDVSFCWHEARGIWCLSFFSHAPFLKCWWLLPRMRQLMSYRVLISDWLESRNICVHVRHASAVKIQRRDLKSHLCNEKQRKIDILKKTFFSVQWWSMERKRQEVSDARVTHH